MFPQTFAFFTTGLLLGVQHSFEADHVAAVSTLVGKGGGLRRAVWAGAVWGFGHTFAIVVVSTTVLLFKLTIPENLARLFEALVGLMLIYLGFMLVKRIVVDKIHIHKHAHGEVEHVHFHSHRSDSGHQHLHRPLLIGMLHGLAGSGGLVVLIGTSMTSILQGVLFTAVFGLGSVLGMIAAGTLVSVPIILAARHQRLLGYVMALPAVAAILIGAHLLYENRIVEWSL